jgi:hypothetical protein
MNVRSRIALDAGVRQAALETVEAARREVAAALDAFVTADADPRRVDHVRAAAERFVAIRRELRRDGIEIVYDA